MSDDEVIEYVVSHTGHNRRQFLVRLLAGSAFAIPVVASFAIGGGASSKRHPLDAGSNQCGPNQMWDDASNMCVDIEDTGSGAGELPDSK
ncbi:MAG TPA: hypothetical protein VMS14_08085 [Ilumatobacteraceae bacterium]|nr:hypothetical protein [Ilumatobacteraceae bacterium]